MRLLRAALAAIPLLLLAIAAAPAPAQSPPPPVNVAVDALGTLEPNVCPGSEPASYTYAVSGTTTGTYPGTFTGRDTIQWDPAEEVFILSGATFAIDSVVGDVEGSLIPVDPASDSPIFCGEGTENAFAATFTSEWFGTITAPDGSRWISGGGAAPDIFRFDVGVWAYRDFMDGNEPERLQPASRQDCRSGGYAQYGFSNEGQCMAFVSRPG